MHVFVMTLWVIIVDRHLHNLVQGTKYFDFHESRNAVHSLMTSGFADVPPHLFYFGEFSTYQDCEEACRKKPECKVWTWHTQEFVHNWRSHCAGYDGTKDRWVDQANVVSGRLIYEFNMNWTKGEPMVNLQDDDFAQCVSTANMRYSIRGMMNVAWPNAAKDSIVIDLTFQGDPQSCDLKNVVVGKISTSPMGCLILNLCDIITPAPTNKKCSYNCSCDSNPCHVSIAMKPSSEPVTAIGVSKIEKIAAFVVV